MGPRSYGLSAVAARAALSLLAFPLGSFSLPSSQGCEVTYVEAPAAKSSEAEPVVGKLGEGPAVKPSGPNTNPKPACSDIDVKELAKLLSTETQIFVSGSDDFQKLTVRWSVLERPSPSVVVVPENDEDVSKIVKFAFEKDVPVFAQNSHHGTLTTLGKMKCGIQINLQRLNSISIAEDDKTVRIGGGINSKKVIDTLWEAGKQAVTGTCECVNFMGPALGGGHGWLQGHHGLIADQLTSMDIVLASGEKKTIDAQSDLWWAMQGAGHNFGIVTSVETKIFPVEHTNWAIATMVFSGDKVEAVYEAANEHILQNGKQSADIHNWSYWLNNPDLDPENPVIVMYIIQEGVTTVDTKYTQPFADLSPLSNTPESGTYKDLAAWTGIALDSPPCQDMGTSNPRFPIYTKAYNTTAQKKAYDTYAAAIGGADSPYTNSIFMFEDYASGGVRARGNADSAFGFRDDLILSAPLIVYAPTDKERDADVERLGNELREILREGTGSKELRAYVNYAYGTEGPESWYGYEGERQERLKALKQKYDPKGKFSFYAPVA